VEIHVLSNLDEHQHALNEYMGREHYSNGVGNFIVSNKEYV